MSHFKAIRLGLVDTFGRVVYYSVDFSKIDSALANFPVGIKIESSTGFMVDLGVADWKNLHATVDGTECYVEIDIWDTVNDKAVLWVKVPTVLIRLDTVIKLEIGAINTATYVGRIGDAAAQNVWDSNFDAVYHMSQDPSGGTDCIKDSTSNGNDGTPDATMTSGDLVDDGFGKSIDFDGDNDRVSLYDHYSTSMSLESYTSVADSSYIYQLVSKDHVSGRQWQFRTETSGRLTQFIVFNSSTYAVATGPTGSFDNSDYHYHVGTYDGSTIKCFTDGVGGSGVSLAGPIRNATYNVFIGERGGTGHDYLKGSTSEVRISKIVRSDAWTKATYHVLNDSLLTYSADAPWEIIWDQNKKGPDLTLSKGNLTVQRTSGNDWEQVLATVGKSSGKWYWEVACDEGGSGYYSVVGVQDGDANLEYHTGQYELGVESIGFMDNARFYRSVNGGYSGVSGGTWYYDSDIVQVALDMDNGKIWFGVNGVWVGASGDSPNPGTGTDPAYSGLSGLLYPAASVYYDLAELTGTFFIDHCRFLPPSGFSYIDGADSKYTSTIWHPRFASDDIVLSSDKKSVSHGGGSNAWINAISNTRRVSGKYYFEIKAIELSDGFLSIGVSDGVPSGPTYRYMGIGRFYQDASFKIADATFTKDDVVGVAIDIDSGNIWWSKNNTWIGCSGAANPNPGTGTDPIYTGIDFVQIVAFVDVYNTLTEAKGFFSESELAYSPPTGFSPLDGTSLEPDISVGIGFADTIDAAIWKIKGIDEEFGLNAVITETEFVVDSHFFGDLQEGDDDPSTTIGDPVLSDYWATFDGSDGYVYTDNLDESSIEGRIVFRAESTLTSITDATIIWKSGGVTHGLCISFADRSDGQVVIGIASRSSNTLYSNDISVSNLQKDVWYELFFSPTKLTVREYSTPANGVTQTKTITISNGTDLESIGYAYGGNPRTGTTSNAHFFTGSVREVVIYNSGKLIFPTGLPLPVNIGVYFGTDRDSDGNATTTYGSPTLNTDCVTFDGNDGYQFGALTDESFALEIRIVFRIEEDFDGLFDYKTIWKSGGSSNGLELGLHNRKLLFGGRSSDSLTTFGFSVYNLDYNVWYEAFISKSKLTIREYSTPANGVTVSGTVIAVDGSGIQCIGYSCDGAPLSALSVANSQFFKGSVREFIVYEGPNHLSWPSDMDTPEYGPYARYDFGSSGLGLYSSYFTQYGTVTNNTDNAEFNGTNNGLYQSSNLWDETDGWGMVIEFAADSFSGDQVLWKSGGSSNGLAVGISSGTIGIFGRLDGSLTSVTMSTSVLSTGTKYYLYAKGTAVSLYNSDLGYLGGDTGTAIVVGNGGDEESVGFGNDSSPISGTGADTDFFDGKIYSVEIWVDSELTFPPTNWHHVENGFGLSDIIDGEFASISGYFQVGIGFSETIGGEKVSVQRHTSEEIGFSDSIDAEHIDQKTKGISVGFGFNETIGAHLSLRNKGIQEEIGLSDIVDGYNCVLTTGITSEIGLSDTIDGYNLVFYKGVSSIIGIDESVNVNLESIVGTEFGLGFADIVYGRAEVRNVGISEEMGFNAVVYGETKGRPDWETDNLGLNCVIGATHYPVKGISEEIGFTGQVQIQKQYIGAVQVGFGLNSVIDCFNAGDLVPVILPNEYFRFIITLTLDTQDDYTLEDLIKVHFTMKSNANSLLSLSAKYTEGAQDFIDNFVDSDTDIKIEMASYLGGVETKREVLMIVDFTEVSYSVGSIEQIIDMSGSKYSVPQEGDTIYLNYGTGKKTEWGNLDSDTAQDRCSYKFARPDFNLRPGHLVSYGVERFIANEVVFQADGSQFVMEVIFSEVLLDGNNDFSYQEEHISPIYRERKFFAKLTEDYDGLPDYPLDNILKLDVDMKYQQKMIVTLTTLFKQNSELSINEYFDASQGSNLVIEVKVGDAAKEIYITVNAQNASHIFTDKGRVTIITGRAGPITTKGQAFVIDNVIDDKVLGNGRIQYTTSNPNLDIVPLTSIEYKDISFIAGDVSLSLDGHSQRMTIENMQNITTDIGCEADDVNILGLADTIVCSGLNNPIMDGDEIAFRGVVRVILNVTEMVGTDSGIGFDETIGVELNP